MWCGWWAAKLKETATEIKIAPSDNLRSTLYEKFRTSESKIFSTVLSSTARFWNLQPESMTLSFYIKEYQRWYQNLYEYCSIMPETNHNMKHLLLFHVQNMQPEIAYRCRDLSCDKLKSDCLKWISVTR